MNHAAPRATLSSFHCLFLLGGFVLASVTGLGAQYAKGKLVPEVHLRNGKVYHGFTVVAVGSTSVVARWEGGQGSIPLAQLPDDMRADLTPPVVAKPAAPAAAPAAPAEEEPDPKLASAEIPTEIKLTNGFVMRKSVIKRWDTHSVLVAYQGGVVTVQFKNMAPEHRAIFIARRDEALAMQAKEDAATREAADDSAARDAEAKRAKDAQDEEAARKLIDEINNGVSFHYLVKGMTKGQVREAYGKPLDERGDSWIYVLRGHDKYGNAADRTLTFTDGHLASWRDQREGDPDGAVEH